MQVTWRTHLLTVAAYVVSTFAVQAASHFGINAAHYAAIPFERTEPIFPFGIGSMLIQGVALSLLFSVRPPARRTPGDALAFAWLAGAILVSYIALGEAGKYTVPSTTSWLAVEIGAGFVQFTAFGLLLASIHRGRVATPHSA
jgi:hypothetical protein